VVSIELADERLNLTRDREPGVFAKRTGHFRVGRGKTAEEIDRWLRTMRGHVDE